MEIDQGQLQMLLVAKARINEVLMMLSEGRTIEGFVHHIKGPDGDRSDSGVIGPGHVQIGWKEIHR